MTLDKNACRGMLEEFFEDYGPYQRFILDIGETGILIRAQKAKSRIPHEDQITLDGE